MRGLAVILKGLYVLYASVKDSIHLGEAGRQQDFNRSLEILDQNYTALRRALVTENMDLDAGRNLRIRKPKKTHSPTVFNRYAGYGIKVASQYVCPALGTMFIDNFSRNYLSKIASAYYAQHTTGPEHSIIYQGRKVPVTFLAVWQYNPLTTDYSKNNLYTTIVPTREYVPPKPLISGRMLVDANQTAIDEGLADYLYALNLEFSNSIKLSENMVAVVPINLKQAKGTSSPSFRKS